MKRLLLLFCCLPLLRIIAADAGIVGRVIGMYPNRGIAPRIIVRILERLHCRINAVSHVNYEGEL